MSLMGTAHADAAYAVFGASGDSGLTHTVQQYQSDFRACQLNGAAVFSLRTFKLNKADVHTVVDPSSLRTTIVKASCLSQCAAVTPQQYSATRYGQVLSGSISAPFPLHNDGLTVGSASKSFVAVTIDMCPSSKGISQNVYDKLVQIATQQKKAVPVGIAMTRKWMQSWPQQFAWLKQLALDGVLDIVWINHSATHVYKPSAPDNQNFMLTPGTNVTDEVLGTEIALIKAGVTPSVFFRFPGLVSSQGLIQKLGDWGVIPLGSQAWLAKGEKAKANSIILIHGNKNEPAGETLFLDYVQKKSADIAWGSLFNILGL